MLILPKRLKTLAEVGGYLIIGPEGSVNYGDFSPEVIETLEHADYLVLRPDDIESWLAKHPNDVYSVAEDMNHYYNLED